MDLPRRFFFARHKPCKAGRVILLMCFIFALAPFVFKHRTNGVIYVEQIVPKSGERSPNE